jgi:hypothetical protein
MDQYKEDSMVGHEAIENILDNDYTDITLRFKSVHDTELLKIDIVLLLESISDEGWVLSMTSDDDYYDY